jgi:hypothetical protein
MGAVTEVTAALNEVTESREALAGDDSTGGVFSCGVIRQLNYSSDALRTLGHAAAAVAEAEVALDLLIAEPTGFGTRAQIEVTRALALLRLRDVNEAHRALRPVLALAPPRRLATLTSRLRPLMASTRVDSGEYAALKAAVMEFCGASPTSVS